MKRYSLSIICGCLAGCSLFGPPLPPPTVPTIYEQAQQEARTACAAVHDCVVNYVADHVGSRVTATELVDAALAACAFAANKYEIAMERSLVLTFGSELTPRSAKERAAQAARQCMADARGTGLQAIVEARR